MRCPRCGAERREHQSRVLPTRWMLCCGLVWHDDGVEYDSLEVGALSGASAEMILAVHSAKRIFGGRVMRGGVR